MHRWLPLLPLLLVCLAATPPDGEKPPALPRKPGWCQPYADKCPACVDCSQCTWCAKKGGTCSVCLERR